MFEFTLFLVSMMQATFVTAIFAVPTFFLVRLMINSGKKTIRSITR